MSKELAVQEAVDITVQMPLLDSFDHKIMEDIGKNLVAVRVELDVAIELGTKTDENASNLNDKAGQARGVISALHEFRMTFTRGIDAVKNGIMDDEKRGKKSLVESVAKAESMLLKREAEIQEAKDKVIREAEEARRAADEAARKEQERRENISKAKGGTGEVAPVIPEQITTPPVEHIGMRSTTRTRWNVSHELIQAAIEDGVREIPGVRIFQVWTFEVEEAEKVPKEAKINGVDYKFRIIGRG